MRGKLCSVWKRSMRNVTTNILGINDCNQLINDKIINNCCHKYHYDWYKLIYKYNHQIQCTIILHQRQNKGHKIWVSQRTSTPINNFQKERAATVSFNDFTLSSEWSPIHLLSDYPIKRFHFWEKIDIQKVWVIKRIPFDLKTMNIIMFTLSRNSSINALFIMITDVPSPFGAVSSVITKCDIVV